MNNKNRSLTLLRLVVVLLGYASGVSCNPEKARTNVTSEDSHGAAPLHREAHAGHTEVVQEIISAPAAVNGRDDSSAAHLHGAAHEGYQAIVQETISALAAVNARDDSGAAPSIALMPQPQPEDTEVASTALGVDKIFCQVRSYLTREDKANLSVTSRGIRTVARNTTKSLDFSVDHTNRSPYLAITDEKLGTIISEYARATIIDHVNLHGCNLITDTGLQALALQCKGLTKLVLSCIPQITNAGLRDLALQCTGLTELNLRRCDLITDDGLKHLALHCTGLTRLNLSFCRLITDAGLKHLALQCTGLTGLNLDGCHLITDDGLRDLALHHAGLTELHLHGCYKITDTGLQALALQCKGLTKLDLSCSPQITDAGLKHLALQCTGLKELCLRECFLANTSLQALRKRYPHIRIYS